VVDVLMVAGEMLAVTPAGKPFIARDTAPLNPSSAETLML
jgi:hypothetical protein